MNILILTPDRVGSTLLQRVITVHMNQIQNDAIKLPVVNLHELTNGIESSYSNAYKKTITCKPIEWGSYDQSLYEITNILKQTQHSVTSRLAHYHLVRRKDAISVQTDFYRYLNKNFYIIACRRNSVFEHALSWGIVSHIGQVNVYSHKDKISTYNELYKSKISINKQVFISYLDKYKHYVEWSNDYFNINEIFVYEEDMPNIDTFIKNLDCFNNVDVRSWNNIFGISWKDWNRCHRLISDLSSIQSIKLLDNLNSKGIMQQLPAIEQDFLKTHATAYVKTTQRIDELVNDRVMVSGVPIKLQTLVEKRMIIKNFNECAVVYNEWADKNNYPLIKDTDEIITQAHDELKIWYDDIPNNLKLLK